MSSQSSSSWSISSPTSASSASPISSAAAVSCSSTMRPTTTRFSPPRSAASAAASAAPDAATHGNGHREHVAEPVGLGRARHAGGRLELDTPLAAPRDKTESTHRQRVALARLGACVITCESPHVVPALAASTAAVVQHILEVRKDQREQVESQMIHGVAEQEGQREYECSRCALESRVASLRSNSRTSLWKHVQPPLRLLVPITSCWRPGAGGSAVLGHAPTRAVRQLIRVATVRAARRLAPDARHRREDEHASGTRHEHPAQSRPGVANAAASASSNAAMLRGENLTVSLGCFQGALQ